MIISSKLTSRSCFKNSFLDASQSKYFLCAIVGVYTNDMICQFSRFQVSRYLNLFCPNLHSSAKNQWSLQCHLCLCRTRFAKLRMVKPRIDPVFGSVRKITSSDVSSLRSFADGLPFEK